MNKIIRVIRCVPYEYKLAGYDLYDSFDQLAKNRENLVLPILSQTTKNKLKIIIANNAAIYSAADKVCFQTARLIGYHPIVCANLNDIKYQMTDFITKKDFYDQNGNPQVDLARQKFFQALVNDKLQESFSSVINRSRHFLNKMKQENSNIIAVSHGFFMKVLEIYCLDKTIARKPQKFLQYYNGSQKHYNFLEGFKINF